MDRFVTAVVLAGGTGSRMGTERPKQFLEIGGRSVLEHAVAAFQECVDVGAVVVVLPRDVPQELVPRLDVSSIAHGGPTRQSSLSEGLVCLPDETELVAVHDAARPLVTRQLITEVCESVGDGFDGAVPAISVDDALRESNPEMEMIRAVPRRNLHRAQTPQVFTRFCIEESLLRAASEGFESEDCAELAMRAGFRVKIVTGDPLNIKITRRADLALAESILAMRGGGHS